MIGQTIGKYRVIDRIGRGGMGTVYRATDDTLRRDVAIKILHAELNDPDVAKRFRAEAITVARLSHPGIATVYELFEHEGQWLMVMELLRGITLEALVEKSGELAPQHAAELCLHVLAALAHAHTVGVVHRDLKPANLMLTESGVVKVMDFGIARVSGTDHLTAGGYMMGTPAYMAPEQVLGREIDARVDLYAMGVVLYRLVTGSLPFRGDSPFALAQSQVNDPPTPAGLVRTDLPAWVDQIISRALAKNPGDRFQTAAAFHDALEQCISVRDLTETGESGPKTPVLPTPAYPVPAGVVWPMTDVVAVPTIAHAVVSGDTAPMQMPPVSSAKTGLVKSPFAFARWEKLVMAGAGAIVLVTLAGAWFWNRTAPPGPAQAVMQPPAPAPVVTAKTPLPASGQSTRPPVPTAGAARIAATSASASAAPSVPAPVPVAAGPTASTTPMPRRGARAGGEHSFPAVQMVVVAGTDAKPQRISLNVSADRLSMVPAAGGKVDFFPIAGVKRATYIHARNPEFDESLAGPAAGINWPGVIGSKHWLVLQSQSGFLVLRLDNATEQVLKAIESTTQLKIQRGSPPRPAK